MCTHSGSIILAELLLKIIDRAGCLGNRALRAAFSGGYGHNVPPLALLFHLGIGHSHTLVDWCRGGIGMLWGEMDSLIENKK